MNIVEKGVVYLIGSGPGDPGLITVKGKNVLLTCDVVVFDLLVPSELIFMLKEKVIKYYVGKKAGQHTLKQSKINDIVSP